MLRASESLATRRLTLRKPALADAEALYARVAGDAEVTRYVSWPWHRSREHTSRVISATCEAWEKDGVGAFLVFDRQSQQLLGTTGLHPASDGSAATGYVFARDAWGRGVATEALLAMVDLGIDLGLTKLSACVHPHNRPSVRVLEKGGFALRGTCRPEPFPNLEGGAEAAVLDYVRELREAAG